MGQIRAESVTFGLTPPWPTEGRPPHPGPGAMRPLGPPCRPRFAVLYPAELISARVNRSGSVGNLLTAENT
jgi:hypothetical protein